jgi:hypothetical protein
VKVCGLSPGPENPRDPGESVRFPDDDGVGVGLGLGVDVGDGVGVGVELDDGVGDGVNDGFGVGEPAGPCNGLLAVELPPPPA